MTNIYDPTFEKGDERPKGFDRAARGSATNSAPS